MWKYFPMSCASFRAHRWILIAIISLLWLRTPYNPTQPNAIPNKWWRNFVLCRQQQQQQQQRGQQKLRLVWDVESKSESGKWSQKLLLPMSFIHVHTCIVGNVLILWLFWNSSSASIIQKQENHTRERPKIEWEREERKKMTNPCHPCWMLLPFIPFDPVVQSNRSVSGFGYLKSHCSKTTTRRRTSERERN